METPFPLSRAERAGLEEQRRLLRALRERGDERGDIMWTWHGDELHSLVVKDYRILVGVR